MFRVAVLALVFLSGKVLAVPSAIEGIAKDSKGQVISGAEIWIEATGGSSWKNIIKTDAKGYYVYNRLGVGTYRVSLIVNGSVKASINNVQTKNGEATKLNFQLKASVKSQALAPMKRKPTHMVWVPSETGSHIRGRWVEVDDTGNADTIGAQNVQRVSGDALREIQSNSSVVRPTAGDRH
jgi:hypothetical protein